MESTLAVQQVSHVGSEGEGWVRGGSHEGYEEGKLGSVEQVVRGEMWGGRDEE